MSTLGYAQAIARMPHRGGPAPRAPHGRPAERLFPSGLSLTITGTAALLTTSATAFGRFSRSFPRLAPVFFFVWVPVLERLKDMFGPAHVEFQNPGPGVDEAFREPAPALLVPRRRRSEVGMTTKSSRTFRASSSRASDSSAVSRFSAVKI